MPRRFPLRSILVAVALLALPWLFGADAAWLTATLASARDFLLQIFTVTQARAPLKLAGLAATLAIASLAVGVMVARATARPNVRPSSRKRIAVPCGPAWLELGDRPIALRGELLRIGEDRDNDLTMANCGLDQHHALIHRTPESEYLVLDVSSAGAAGGLAVNGHRLAQAALKDGDCIEIGTARLRFRRPGPEITKPTMRPL